MKRTVIRVVMIIQTDVPVPTAAPVKGADVGVAVSMGDDELVIGVVLGLLALPASYDGKLVIGVTLEVLMLPDDGK